MYQEVVECTTASVARDVGRLRYGVGLHVVLHARSAGSARHDEGFLVDHEALVAVNVPADQGHGLPRLVKARQQRTHVSVAGVCLPALAVGVGRMVTENQYRSRGLIMVERVEPAREPGRLLPRGGCMQARVQPDEAEAAVIAPV